MLSTRFFYQGGPLFWVTRHIYIYTISTGAGLHQQYDQFDDFAGRIPIAQPAFRPFFRDKCRFYTATGFKDSFKMFYSSYKSFLNSANCPATLQDRQSLQRVCRDTRPGPLPRVAVWFELGMYIGNSISALIHIGRWMHYGDNISPIIPLKITCVKFRAKIQWEIPTTISLFVKSI